MMKKLIPQLLATILLVASLISCSSNNDEEDFPEVAKTYEFVSIQWKIDKNDKEESIKNKQPTVTFFNRGTAEAGFDHNSLENMIESSRFESQDIDYINIDQNVEVAVPDFFSILTAEYGIVFGDRKASIEANKLIKIEPTSSEINSLKVHPNTQVTINTTLHMKKLTATYLITLAEKDNKNNTKEVTGKWEGVFLDWVETSIEVTEIK